MIDLVNRQQEYIDLLTEELHELAPFAVIHGWQSNKVEQGETIRHQIQTLKNKYNDEGFEFKGPNHSGTTYN